MSKPPIDPYVPPSASNGKAAPHADHEPPPGQFEDGSPPAPTEGPLQGLGHLAAVATVGYAALVADTADPIRWLWRGVISEANHVELAGPSGGGKTTLATLFVAALANPGEPVVLFGREVTPIGPGQHVVFVQEENGKHSVRKKMETACAVLGLPVKDTLDRVIFVVRRNVRVGDAVWQDIVELGRRGGVGAVFIDSRARVLRNGESNSEEDQAAVADALFALIETARAPAFVVSHTRKGGAASIEDLAGSLQRGAGADVIVMVDARRDTSGRVLAVTITTVKIRDDVEEHPDPVEFTIGRDLDGTPSLKSTVPAQDKRPVETRILEALESEGPLTRNDLAVKVGRSKADVQPALDALFAAGRLRGATVSKKNGQSYPGLDIKRGRRAAGGQDLLSRRSVALVVDAIAAGGMNVMDLRRHLGNSNGMAVDDVEHWLALAVEQGTVEVTGTGPERLLRRVENHRDDHWDAGSA